MNSAQGILGIFSSPDTMKAAAKKIRASQFSKVEAFSPFPVHGLEKAMGLPKSWISRVTLITGLAGAFLLFAFQVWTMAYDWPVNVGGKPLIAWQAYIPVTFEGMVLIGGISTVVALFVACRLPSRAPVLDLRFTNNKFGIFIDRTDPRFDEAAARQLFQGCAAEEIINVA